MFDGKSPFVLLDDVRACDAAPARLYRDPVGVIRADKMEDLEACFAAVSRARMAGQHVAGYLSYEAGLGLEERLRGKIPADLPAPLAWFGIFNDYIELGQDNLVQQLPDRNGAWLGRLEPSISREKRSRIISKPEISIRPISLFARKWIFPDILWRFMPQFAAARRPAMAAWCLMAATGCFPSRRNCSSR